MDAEDILFYAAVLIAGVVLFVYAFFPDPPKSDYISLAKLRLCDGVQKPFRLLACNGVVFDVTKEPMYAPGEAYNLFVGHDASVALAKMDLSGAHLDEPVDGAGLTETEMKVLKDWEAKLRSKYAVVGQLAPSKKDS